jgi:hypothetical protein
VHRDCSRKTSSCEPFFSTKFDDRGAQFWGSSHGAITKNESYSGNIQILGIVLKAVRITRTLSFSTYHDRSPLYTTSILAQGPYTGTYIMHNPLRLTRVKFLPVPTKSCRASLSTFGRQIRVI